MSKADIAQQIADLPPEKRALLYAKLRQQEGRAERSRGADEGIPRVPRDAENYELSFAQQRLWFLSEFDPESPEYNIPLCYRLRGILDSDVMRRAMTALVERHEVLRTSYVAVEGEGRQVLNPLRDSPMTVVDLKPRPAERRLDDALYETSVDAQKPFDLARGPMVRSTLFRLDDDDHLIYFNFHHIAFDGWSNGVLLKELMAIYHGFVAGEKEPLEELAIQYLDFAVWQRGWLQGDELERQLGYWKKQIAGTPPLEIVTDRPRPAVRKWGGTTCPVDLGADLSKRLVELSRRESCTLFVTLLAALRALFARYTHQDDFAVGTLIANRTRPELEGLIGFFANTLVLRTPLHEHPTFRQLMHQERQGALDAYDHQDLPFEKVIEELNPPRDLSRTPYFQVMFILQNAPVKAEKKKDIEIGQVGVDSKTAKFDLTLYLTQGENVAGFLEYSTDLFDRETVVRLMHHYKELLQGIVADPDRRIHEYPLMGGDEEKLVVTDWNQTAADYPRDLTVPRLFERQVDLRGDDVAMVCGEESLTYRELDLRANRLAHHLLGLGVEPEQFVGVCTDRSSHLLVSLLAVGKAGCAYLPLDPDYPDDRIAYMLEDTAAPVVLSLKELAEKLPQHGARTVILDDLDLSGEPTDRPAPRSVPSNLAYVIHTSGSTGKPKGVAIPHQAVVNFLTTMAQAPGLKAGDTLLAVTTISFDIAGLELFLPLSVGAKVVVASRETASAGEQLTALLNSSGANVMQATPATWQLLYGAGWEGNPNLKVLCGGEALPTDLAERLLGTCREVWNVYGPTEATIWSTIRKVDADDLKGGAVSIGRPIGNTTVYLVDRNLRPVPIGVPGELLLGGDGLARGYLNRPSMAADRFLPDPFGPKGGRLYRTGDLVRSLPDGSLHFLGRLDHQVKVHGYRIELGEIETVLDHHPDIERAVVIVREDTPGVVRLVAYMVPPKGKELPKPDALKDHLKKKVPEYMVPAIFVPLEELPLTPNGKVDRRALPKPDPSLLRTTEYVPPEGEKEIAFAAIFSEILGIPEVGRNDDFFDLGGDSLLVIRVVTRAKKEGLVVTTKQLFQHRTVAELTKVEGSSTILAEQGEVVGDVPMSPAQVHFLSLGHTLPEYHAIGGILSAKQGAFDLDALKGAFKKVLEHHDSLRMRLLTDGGYHMVGDPMWDELPLEIFDLRDVPAEEQEEAFKESARTFIRTAFKFDDGPLYKAQLYHMEDNKDFLVLLGHFMAADIGSWQIILDDLDTAYRQLSRGEALELQPKTTSFKQWIERLTERANSKEMESEYDYWLDPRRKDAAKMPRDFPEGVNTMRSSKSIWMEFDEKQTETLVRTVTRSTGTQIDAVILTAVLYAFEHWTGGTRSLLIDLLGHGREALYDDIDLTRTVGWVNTIYPSFLTLGDAPHPVAALKSLNRQLRAIPNGGIGYGLLRYLNKDPKMAARLDELPEPELFFNYFGDDMRSELTVLSKDEEFGGWGFDLETKRLRPLGVFVYIREKKMRVRWEYSTNINKDETMEDASRVLRQTLEYLIENH